jgi:hypothetical protein
LTLASFARRPVVAPSGHDLNGTLERYPFSVFGVQSLDYVESSSP